MTGSRAEAPPAAVTAGSAAELWRTLGRRLALIPIQVIMRDLRRQGMDPSRMRALEVFG
jgi:hypothetical protein